MRTSTVHRQIVEMTCQRARERRADLASDHIAPTAGNWSDDLDWQILQGGYCIDACPALAVVTASDIPRDWF